MSFDIMIYAERCNLPSAARWASAIRQLGFDLRLESDFDLATATGFRPCRLSAQLTGFEYALSPGGKHAARKLSVPLGADVVEVTLRAGGASGEIAAALIAAGVLCELTRGVLHDPQYGDEVPGPDAYAWIRDRLSQEEP